MCVGASVNSSKAGASGRQHHSPIQAQVIQVPGECLRVSVACGLSGWPERNVAELHCVSHSVWLILQNSSKHGKQQGLPQSRRATACQQGTCHSVGKS